LIAFLQHSLSSPLETSLTNQLRLRDGEGREGEGREREEREVIEE
jgi:hypothetical protein